MTEKEKREFKRILYFLGFALLTLGLVLSYARQQELIRKYNELLLERMTTAEATPPELPEVAQASESIQDLVVDLAKEKLELKAELDRIKERGNEYVGRWIATEIIELEGHESNHANDPGGYTKFGISSKIHGFVPKTKEEAIQFYLQKYWYGMKLNKLRSVRLQFALMDAAVLFGDGYVKSTVVNLIDAENYDAFIEKVSTYFDDDEETDELIELLKSKLKNRIRQLTKQNYALRVFANGWTKRVERY